MRAIFFILFFTYNLSASSQWAKLSIEPYSGLNYYRSLKRYYPLEPYSGFERLLAAKALFTLGDRMSIAGGGGVAHEVGFGNWFFNATSRIYFLKNYETKFSLFVEGGIQIYEVIENNVLLYLGTQQYFGEGIALNFRWRIPTFIDMEYLNWTNHLKTGFELGLQFDFDFDWMKKPITGSGNPFILQ